jgi:hypothetical protein
MNPVALYFASGDSLYAGAGLLLIAIVISRYLTQVWMMRARNLIAWLALALLVMACPPFSWIVDAVFIGTFALWLAVANQWLAWRWAEGQAFPAALLLIVLATLTAFELSHRRMPKIVGDPSDHLVVIGDSISSGIDPRVPAWPTVMQQLTNIQVKNLSRAGARIIDGLDMAGNVTSTIIHLTRVAGVADDGPSISGFTAESGRLGILCDRLHSCIC